MTEATPLLSLTSREHLAGAVADVLAGVIEAALARRPRASIALSGGGTPGPAYRLLAGRALDWSRVDIALVDERWVAPDAPGSNEALVRDAFAAAAGVTVHPMWRGTETVHGDVRAAQADLAQLRPFDAVLLGMGADAHTASWFPGAAGLDAALDPATPDTIAVIDATGCPGAQGWPVRITLTLPPVAEAGWVGLMLSGADKRAVLDAALAAPPAVAPVRAALESAAPRAVVFWAP